MTPTILSRRGVLAGLAAGAAMLAVEQWHEAEKIHWNGITPWRVGDSLAQLSLPDSSHIRLLQVTDLHFLGNPMRSHLDARTREDLLRLVERCQPHLLLVTGDLWHDNRLHSGRRGLEKALTVLRELDCPWLFTWGNHDRLDDYAEGHQALSQAPRSLYRGGPHSGCYTVRLVDRRQGPLWDLFCLNSMEIGLSEPQRQWLRKEARPSAGHAFAVFHIPLQQFTGRRYQGHRLEDVCHEGENGSTLALLQRLGNVRACLVGHDHLNDYQARVEGMDLIYGRATGHAGYGGHRLPKGAKLYRLNAENGRYHWATVSTTAPDWVPPGHERHWQRALWEG